MSPQNQVDAFVDGLTVLPVLGEARRWWPTFVFRFEDIEAAAKILNEGRIYSRTRALELGQQVKECGSTSVLGNTDPRWKNFVRLYFRPKTPMLYRVEGFRTRAGRNDGYCPAPVYFMFSSKALLGRESTEISDGNLATTTTRTGRGVEFLRTIPFDRVFHEGGFPRAERDEIVHRRHAEVIVPNELDLADLKQIACRSAAEYSTLISLLDFDALIQWSRRMSVQGNLFYCEWAYVEVIELSATDILFKFRPDAGNSGPFVFTVDITDTSSEIEYRYHNAAFRIPLSGRFRLRPGPTALTRYKIRATLDGDLACMNDYSEEIPF